MFTFILVLFFLSGVFLFFLFFLMESIVAKLSDNHPFKKWWKRNVVDEDPTDKINI